MHECDGRMDGQTREMLWHTMWFAVVLVNVSVHNFDHYTALTTIHPFTKNCHCQQHFKVHSFIYWYCVVHCLATVEPTEHLLSFLLYQTRILCLKILKATVATTHDHKEHTQSNWNPPHRGVHWINNEHQKHEYKPECHAEVVVDWKPFSQARCCLKRFSDKAAASRVKLLDALLFLVPSRAQPRLHTRRRVWKISIKQVTFYVEADIIR